MLNTKDKTRKRGVGGPGAPPPSQHPTNPKLRVPKGGLPPPSKSHHHHHNQQLSPQTDGQSPGFRPWGPRTSATLPNPVTRPQGRVRVQAGAGDKCVAQAKSKYKQRQGVPGRPVDLSTLSMDSVIWSEETYGVEQLVHAYGTKLPVIIKVVEGFHCECGLDLSVNEVVQIHSFDKQVRVRAQTNSGGLISIPSTYNAELFIKGSLEDERWSLSQALKSKRLPFTAQVMSVDEQLDVSTVNVVGSHLTFTTKHTEVFLRANTIKDGWIDQQGIHAIPAFLGASFSVAVGMRGAAEAEWKDYYGMFARSVRHLNYSLLTGFEGILIEDDGGGSIKLQYPKPKVPVYENLNELEEKKRASTLGDPRPSTSMSEARQSHPYENWQKSPTNQNVFMRQRSDEPMILPQRSQKSRPKTMDVDDDYSKSSTPTSGSGQNSEDGRLPEGLRVTPRTSPRDVTAAPVLHLPDLVSNRNEVSDHMNISPRRSGTPFSEASEGDLEEMFQSVLDVAEEQETLQRQREQEEKRRQEQQRLEEQRIEEQRRHQEERRLQEIHKMEMLQAKARHDRENARNVSTLDARRPMSPTREHNEQNDKITKENYRRDREDSSITPALEFAQSIMNRPSYRSSTSSRDSQDIDSIVPIKVDVHRDPSPRVSSVPAPKDVKSLLNQFESHPPASSTSNLNRSFGSNNNLSNNDSPAKRSPPKAVVAPTVYQSHVVQINITDSTDVINHIGSDINANRPSDSQVPSKSNGHINHGSTTIETIDDVPKELDNLSIEDILQCLRLLNMERHLPEFRKYGIDGNILTNSKEHGLIINYGMTPFNASKMMRFIRGWRPKSM